ncbi:MAG TPA: DNA methyltransferase, partial [Methanoculleus sp.]|nr:DNA methyltransferase [Methanoculleus sp.]
MMAKKDAGNRQTSLNSCSGGEAVSRAKGTPADRSASALPAIASARDLDRHLRTFRHQRDGVITDTVRPARVEEVNVGDTVVRRYIGEFWTAKQRGASTLHEVSYRACFKPQLPRFFIDRLTAEGDSVYDPFGGRGTTIIEATLAGRRGISNDVNPLSEIFASPRLHIPGLSDIEKRLREIPLDKTKTADIDLSMFYHAETLGEIVSLKEYLQERRATGKED